MTVFIDDYNAPYKRMIMCHMMSDTSVEELHAMAEKIGVKREWFQTGSAPHYDVCKEKKKLALQYGAIELPILIDGRSNPEWRRVYKKARALRQK